MTHLTTHVLDAATGVPATGVAVELTDAEDTLVAAAVTDADGRAALGPERLAPGRYALTFGTAAYFARSGVETFYPEVTVTFEVTVAGADRHLHVPLLLSPFAYSTYRGS
ncbi:5-hydroxyisourate hydrolase [Isoptericola jiangsuensis]|uniref:5-hydroxyisourate hydrolase n=1 Tax=Isoptericola jiangsuensis TaxID=548579 RepID=A0A2A9EV06_9MICO|nr:hydroxyisourate hydrolase [Isoptericola jiangsuensis]PFG42593.1 5-hydroxyisourate hydrolase [Isoptericola jiangsuensis]